MAIPVIYKGDDTDFRGSTGFTLKVVTSSNLNLSGCTVEVEVLGFRRSFPASATGELVCPFAFTAAETQRMPLGIHAAIVRVFDSKGRVRTINNSIRVKVTNVLSEAYSKDDPQEVTLAVSTVDLEAYAKKKEVTAAIEKAMKDASASVKLHALTPEVTDTTVTLKPVDGAANYVDGRVEAQSRIVGRNFSATYKIWCEYLWVPGDESENHMISVTFTCPINEGNSVIEGIYPDEFEGEWRFRIITTQDIPAEIDSRYPELFKGAMIPKGTRLSYLIYDLEIEEGCNTDLSQCSFRTLYSIPSPWYAITPVPENLDVDGKYYNRDLYELDEGRSVTHQVVRRDITAAVAIPASADTAKARSFTLAVETDVEAEKAVEWQGGEVIEAVPGASKLVPGLNVWDVAEVAPGKFSVDRASTPAQSAPLTLTAPNGRVAELVVGDDLVLEVKEV